MYRPANYLPFLLAPGSVRNSCMAMFVHSLVIEATGRERLTWTEAETCRYESFNEEEQYMTRRIPQIVLALAIVIPYAFLHAQSTKAFNGFDLVDKVGNIRK